MELNPTSMPVYAIPDGAEKGSTTISAVIASESCKLWKLLHEINSHNYGDETQIRGEDQITFVRTMLRRLLQWSDGLSASMARGNRSTQEIMIMQ